MGSLVDGVRYRFRPHLAALIALVALIALYFFTPTATVELPQALRLTRGEDQKTEYLEVPIVSYTHHDGFVKDLQVDFVGAVHLGDRAYYEGLNTRFRGYDAVLYELVSDGEHLPEKGGARTDSLLGSVQRGLSNLMGLTFQLDEIDYRARNFIHADLTPDQLRAAMTARGESLPQLLMKIIKLSSDPEIAKGLQSQDGEDPLEGINPLMIVLRGPTADDKLKIRRFMAKGLVGSDAVLKLMEGENGFSLITDRNAAVVSVLKREVGAGKRKVAIFYGVGHLPDLHKRLTDELGLTLKKVEWVRAWRM
jgi:hypothetical protein